MWVKNTCTLFICIISYMIYFNSNSAIKRLTLRCYNQERRPQKLSFRDTEEGGPRRRVNKKI